MPEHKRGNTLGLRVYEPTHLHFVTCTILHGIKSKAILLSWFLRLRSPDPYSFKYAMIIQIFDTFYEGGEKLSEEIELKYLNIGITVAEEAMNQIKSFLEYRQATKDTLKYREDDYLEIAKKVKNYLKKYNFDENNPLPSSKLIRQVRGLNQTNFNKVLEFASLNYGVKSEQKEWLCSHQWLTNHTPLPNHCQ